LPSGKDFGHCPRCLLDLALAPSRAASSGGGGTPAPAIEVLEPLLPDFELQELLGRGGMGAVYRARQKKLDRLVAIKVLLPDLVAEPSFAERFEREAKALARLHHPGIVGIHDFGRAATFFYLVMEFVDGASLRDLLLQGQLTARDVLALVPQLCDALQYAHDHRIVHRDIKPENILIDQDGRVRIADFGLAKLIDAPSTLGLTRTAQAVGTPLYMAPEQVHAANLVDHRADLYSLGVVIYEMLTGQLPIGRFQAPSTKNRTPRELDPVVMKSLENDPEHRYQAARDVKRDVEAAGLAREGAPQPTAATTTATADRPATAAARAPAAAAAASHGDAAPRATPGTPWLFGGVVLAAAFMPWIYANHAVGSSVPLQTWGLERFHGELAASAWHTTLFGVPAWLLTPMSLCIVLAKWLPTRGHPVQPLLALWLAAIGAIYTLAALLMLGSMDWATAGLGLYATFVAFATKTWSEFHHRPRPHDPQRFRAWRRRQHRRERLPGTP
jgi:tRNA A-37 threonylcarbamoyl transferase component Bud32/type IV secretory pathway TrbD component